MNSLDDGATVGMSYKALLEDPDTRNTDAVCPDVCLAALGVVDILLVFLSALQIQVRLFKFFANGDEVNSLWLLSGCFFDCFEALFILVVAEVVFSSISLLISASARMFLKPRTVWS